jgi:hypothetical protein
MTEPAEKGELIYENVDTAPIVYFDIAPAHAATPHRAEGVPAPEGFTANMNYCLLMEETGKKKGRFCPR